MTTETYRWTVGQFVSFCEREGITPQTLSLTHTTAYMGEVKKRPGRKKAPEGEEQKIGAWGRYALGKDARNFLNWLHENRYLEYAVKVPVPKTPKVSTPHLETKEKISALQESAKGSRGRNCFRDMALIDFMLETGLRNFEVRAVNWGHLSFQAERPLGHVLVPTGKGRKQRIVPFPADVWRALGFWKMDVERFFGQEAIGDDAPVFVKENGQRMTKDTMRMLFQRLSMRASVVLSGKMDAFKVTPHMLRHTYAITMVKRNLHITVLQKFMGHADIKTTMIYLQLTEDDGTDELYLAALRNGA